MKKPPTGTTSDASIYVALSRVKTIDDLLILRPWADDVLSLKQLAKPRSDAFIEEMKRLETHDEKTAKHFSKSYSYI